MDCNVSFKCSECGKRIEFNTTMKGFNLRILIKALEGMQGRCTSCALKDLIKRGIL